MVRPDSVQMTLSSKDLASLPKGAVYTNKIGRAHIQAKLIHDTLHLRADCDSIVVHTVDKEVSSREYSKSHTYSGPAPWQWFWIRLGQIAGGLLGTIILYKGIKMYVKKK